jgi:DUF4097 and DUF4098 domain-containing protein YvlB
MQSLKRSSQHLTKPALLFTIVALLLVACEAGSTQKYSHTRAECFAVDDSSTLAIDNFYGDVTIRDGEEGTVEVVATKRAAREMDLERIEVEISQENSSLEIRTGIPFDLNNISVELKITAPTDTQVNLESGGGDVTIVGIAGRVQAVTGGGDVEVWEAKSSLDVETGGGNITVFGAKGSLHAETAGGDIEVHDAHGKTTVSTGGGNIQILGANGEIQVNTGAGDIDYQGHPQDTCRFDTGRGHIKLRLPADINARVELETSDGDIDVDWPIVGYETQRRVRGNIGSGDEGTIRADTGNGDIDVIRQ